jgi:hypothetical protein
MLDVLIVIAAGVAAACAIYGLWRLESCILTRHTQRRAEHTAYLRAVEDAKFWRGQALTLQSEKDAREASEAIHA